MGKMPMPQFNLLLFYWHVFLGQHTRFTDDVFDVDFVYEDNSGKWHNVFEVQLSAGVIRRMTRADLDSLRARDARRELRSGGPPLGAC